MVIDEEILFTYRAEIRNYKAGEAVFTEGSVPKFYYQIRSGLVKLNVYKDDGSEFIHSLPSAGHCLAETFLWYDSPYCINAIIVNDAKMIRLKKDIFFDLVNKRADLMSNLMAYTSERMFNRYRMLTTLSINNPSYTILNILDFLKSHHNVKKPFEYIFPFSRQQLGSLTGLRVETVIRAVKKLEKQNLVKISNRKICF